MLCAIFNVILLLNLLIAIISQTFTTISEKKNETGYKEKARLVKQMQTTFNWLTKTPPNHNERIFIAQVIKSDQMHKDGVHG